MTRHVFWYSVGNDDDDQRFEYHTMSGVKNVSRRT
jgi:hypothetical protein